MSRIKNDNNEENRIELIPQGNSPSRVETSIFQFNQPLSDLLTHVGLPTEMAISVL